VSAVKKARDKVIVFVSDGDRRHLEALISALEGVRPQSEADYRSALGLVLRVHAYLV
jgi:hypothetical protein